MTDEKFWDLIALIDWRHEPDEEQMLRLLRMGLQREEPPEIESFQRTLTEKLQALDTPIRYKAAKEPSADCFLYLRLYVVGRGRAFYAHVGNVSRWMPDPLKWLESLLYVAREAYLSKTGHELADFDGMSHESFTSAAWTGPPPVMRRGRRSTNMTIELLGLYPVQKDVHLIEIMIKGTADGVVRIGDFTQPKRGVRRSSWQVAYDEYLLNRDGTDGFSIREVQGIPIEMDLRVTFYMHHLDLTLPIATPVGELRLPSETPRPERLKFLKYAPPD